MSMLSTTATGKWAHVWNCSEGKVEYHMTRKDFASASRDVATWLLQNRMYKYLNEDGYFNGTLAILHRGNIFHQHCTRLTVEIFWSEGCHYPNVGPSRTPEGQLLYSGDDDILVEHPAKAECISMEMGPEVQRTREIQTFSAREQEAKHTLFALAQALHRKPLEDLSHILYHEEAIESLEEAIETGVDQDDAITVDTWVHRVYKRHFSKYLAWYALLYTIYTIILTIIALGLRIPIIRALRMFLPAVRRLSDLVTYHRDQAMHRQAQQLRERRDTEGLNQDPPPIFDYTVAHLTILYRSILEINQRIDALHPEQNAQIEIQSIQSNSSQTTPSPSPKPSSHRHPQGRVLARRNPSFRYRPRATNTPSTPTQNNARVARKAITSR